MSSSSFPELAASESPRELEALLTSQGFIVGEPDTGLKAWDLAALFFKLQDNSDIPSCLRDKEMMFSLDWLVFSLIFCDYLCFYYSLSLFSFIETNWK